LDIVAQFIDIVLHLDKHLVWVVQNYGAYIYVVLFAIIFCETGLVVTPFLPGDSLLFVAGTLAATGHMDVHGLFATLALASFLGDNTNYWIGRYTGPKVFHSSKSRWLNRAYLERTHEFYARHGGKTIVIARFMPIVRTFAPFVAGVGSMTYPHFLTYNVLGGFLWVTLFVFAGYFFGSVPFVKEHFELVIIGIIAISVIPVVYEFLRSRLEKRQQAGEATS
jgi:membrane-associated protein